LGYIAQALLDNNIEYDVLDIRMQNKFRHLKGKIEDFNPDLIGLSLITYGYLRSYGLISHIREVYPEAKIVVGGPHVTATQKKVLSECPEIDYAVFFEGETTILELCQGRNIEDIAGLIHRQDGEIIYNGNRPLCPNIDPISFPRYEHFDLKQYTRERPIISSRGCPYRCIFCPNNLITKRFRARSARNVVDEIEYWYDRGIRQFNFDDDNFTFSKQRVHEICQEIEDRKLEKLLLRCSNGIRADRVDRELLARMKEVGFREVGFGVDGGNNKALQNIKKGESIEEIEEAIKNACELGYDVKLFFLIGSPGETRKDIEDSLRIVEKYPIQRVNLSNPIPYPGTELYDWIAERNYFLREPKDYLNDVTEDTCAPVFETPELPARVRVAILKRCRKVELKVTREVIKRRYSKFPIFRSLAAYIFGSRIGENLYFRSNTFRKLIEGIRYRKLILSSST